MHDRVFQGPWLPHKKLIDFESKAIADSSPSALVVASVNDWVNLLALSKKDLGAFFLAFDKLLFSLSLIDCQDAIDLNFYFSTLPSIVNKMFFINNIPPIPLKLQQEANIANPLLDLDLLELDEKKALSLSNPCPSPLGFKEVSKAFSSVIPLLPARQVELDALRADHKLWDYELLKHKALFSLS